jgi:hypothetical protein
MIGVDKIGQIRRAVVERHLPIKGIVPTLSVSRATVRKVIRYERGVPLAPKLADWAKTLTGSPEKEARLSGGTGSRSGGCSKNCVVVAMTAPSTACTGSRMRGGTIGNGFRYRRSCR